jgi:hypothetical protein
MQTTNAQKGKFKAYGLVRDANGKPKIDDIHNIPGPIWDMLTTAEKEEINHVRNTSCRHT